MPMQTTDQWGSLLPAGIGNDQQATQATGAMRQSPWYQDWMKQNNLTGEGDQYGNVKLSDDQQGQLADLARKNGIGISDSYQIDQNGQIAKTPSHLWRNIGIGAAMGGLALTGLGAAGIGPLAGAFGAGAGGLGATEAGIAGSEAAGAAGAGAAGAGLTTAGIGTGGLVGGAGAGLGAAGAGAGLGAGAGAAGLGAGLTGAGVGLGETAGGFGVGGLGAESLGLGATMPAGTSVGALMGGAIPGGTGIGSGLPGSMGTGSLVSGGTGQALSGGGSMVSKLMGGLKNPQNLADLSKMANQYATDAQGNRIIQGNMANNYDRNMLAAQQSRDQVEEDAMRKLAQTKYLLSGGYTAGPQQIQLGGRTRTLPTFGMNPTPSSDAQKQGAQTLQDQLIKRLAPGGTYTPMPFSDYGTPGVGENIGRYAGLGLSGAGLISKLFGG